MGPELTFLCCEGYNVNMHYVKYIIADSHQMYHIIHQTYNKFNGSGIRVYKNHLNIIVKG